uniref:Sugar fermentation stimulation protein C-terminal domain-containing protein n=1 Tax=viral metagenome TaxID=1070528 RepID=A0A6C0DHH6_9ZZZZ
MIQTTSQYPLLFKLENLVSGEIIKRPSKIIKSPYVADAQISEKENEPHILLHTASLGCCGLSDTGAKIQMAKINNDTTTKKSKDAKDAKHAKETKHKPKCEYRAYLSIYNDDTIIGIYPKLAEDIVEQSIVKNYLSRLQLKNTSSYKRETKIYVENKVDSRFDFSGIDANGIPFIMEVKNVPLADFEDITSIQRKKKNYAGWDPKSKIAYFPDGYRKKTTDPVSPRALKHIHELTTIKKESITRCIMCYVIQRTDVNRFTISTIDAQYKAAVKSAIEAGVEIIIIVAKWEKTGEVYFVTDNLPLVDMDDLENLQNSISS